MDDPRGPSSVHQWLETAQHDNPKVPVGWARRILRFVARWILGLSFFAVIWFARSQLDPVIGKNTPFILLYVLPVGLAAWYTGLGPALACIVLGALFGDRLLQDPSISLLAKSVRTGAYFLECGLAAMFIRRFRKTIQVQLVALTHSVADLRVRENEVTKLALVASRTSNAIAITDPKGKVEWVNAAFEALTRLSNANCTGRQLRELLGGPDPDTEMWSRLESHIFEGHPFRSELAGRSGAGRNYWADIQVQPSRDTQGTLANFIVVLNDITESKDILQRLRQSEQRNRLIIDTALDAVVIVDATGARR